MVRVDSWLNHARSKWVLNGAEVHIQTDVLPQWKSIEPVGCEHDRQRAQRELMVSSSTERGDREKITSNTVLSALQRYHVRVADGVNLVILSAF